MRPADMLDEGTPEWHKARLRWFCEGLTETQAKQVLQHLLSRSASRDDLAKLKSALRLEGINIPE